MSQPPIPRSPDMAEASGRKSWHILVICAFAAFADGYDIQALGLAIPRMAAHFQMEPAAFTLATSTSLIGMAIGALFLSPLGDRYGRERTLAAMLGMIALTTFAIVIATTPFSIAIYRFFSGLGLGAAVPIAVALTSDNVSDRHRATLITIMVSCTGVGAFAAGQLAPLLDSLGDWKAIFGLGAILPLIGAVLAWIIAPARIGAPARTGAQQPQGQAMAERPPKASVAVLFARPLCFRTMVASGLFWFNLMMNYSIISWLPTLLHGAGWDMAAAARATGLISIGGIVGGLAISMLADRGKAIRALFGAYGVAAAALATFSLIPADKALWTALLLLVGLSAFGAQLALSAIVAAYYPSAVRGTAIGWSSGFGRSGAFIGPIIIAAFMTSGLSSANILTLMMVPMLFCLMGVALLPYALRPSA